MYTCYIQSFSILASSVTEQAGLDGTWSIIPKDTYLCEATQIAKFIMPIIIHDLFPALMCRFVCLGAMVTNDWLLTRAD